MTVRSAELRPAALHRLAAIVLFAMAALLAVPQPVAAQGCAGPHCDPNWAFQNQMLAQRAQEQQQMEAHMRQMDMYYNGQQNGSSGSYAPPPELPRYTPPPPPKGWQSRYTGFVSFKVGQDEDRDSNRFRYGYALAMNHASEAEARAEAARMCRERVLRAWESHDIDYMCENQVQVVHNAFVTLVQYSSGNFGVNEQPTLDLAVNQHGHGVEINGRVFYCASPSEASPDTCQSTLVALGQNGVHRKVEQTRFGRIGPCPQGPTQANEIVVGVDRTAGAAVPVCGPDPVALRLRDVAGKWDAYATHPRFVVPFAAGGFANLATAQQAVLAMCDRFTGGGCQPAGEARDTIAVWVRDDEGRLFLGTGPSEADALAQARARCGVGAPVPCSKVVTRFAGDLRVYGPNYMPSDLRYFGAVALPSGKVGADRQAWIAMNQATQAEAERSALDACQRENADRHPCVVVARGLGTRFIGYTGQGGIRGVVPVMVRGSGNLIDLEERVEATLAAVCGARGTQCTVTWGIDASDDGEDREAAVTTIRWPLS